MKDYPRRLFLDTNVYIIGAAVEESAAATILDWAGFAGPGAADVEIVLSAALVDQIRGVARRLGGKDWAGQILMRIWRHMNVRFVLIDLAEGAHLAAAGNIPREDIEIFLAARAGEADCFISANRELVGAIARQTGAFACMTPEEFVRAYLSA